MADNSLHYVAALEEAKLHEAAGDLKTAVKWLRTAESRTSDADEREHLIVWRTQLERELASKKGDEEFREKRSSQESGEHRHRKHAIRPPREF